MSSDPKHNVSVTPGKLSFVSEMLISDFYNLVLRAFKESGLSQAELAKSLGKDKSQLSRQLNSPGNWTLETAAKLYFAVSGRRVTPVPQEVRHSLASKPALEAVTGPKPMSAENRPTIVLLDLKPFDHQPSRMPTFSIGTQPVTRNVPSPYNINGGITSSAGIAAE